MQFAQKLHKIAGSETSNKSAKSNFNMKQAVTCNGKTKIFWVKLTRKMHG